jgi:uncharacterized protein YukE
MGLGSFFNGLGDGAEHLLSGAEHLAGDSIDGVTRGIADGLDSVGLHGAAQAEREYGDNVANMLGAQVSELSLGETTNPKDLIHGDPAAIEKTAGELKKFQAAFEETFQGLSGLDQMDWEGQAAQAFRAKYLDHPKKWADAADACGAAAAALSAYATTVTWAQGQAQKAIDEGCGSFRGTMLIKR